MSENGIVIVAAKRTPQGRFLGLGAKLSAVDLAVGAGRAALDGIAPEAIDQVVIGNVLAAGSGMNVARQVALRLGLPQRVPAYTVNLMCGSGMQAVLLAAQAIRAGEAEAILCGGCESMSNAPLLEARHAEARPIAERDTLIRDGLSDPLSGEHMGLTAERLATDFGITRADQDAYARESHRRFGVALADGRFAAEIVAVDGLDRDEHHRPVLPPEKLASLKPVFATDGTVTAGNASGLNDGAAMLVVASAAAARRHGWPVLARIAHGTVVGCEPARMGLGPVHAIRRLQERHGLRLDACDAIELNEAFAAQAIACQRELGLDHTRINADGGAIAVGHPIGATGARLITHLAHRHAAGAARQSLASLCIGGGMGAVIVLTAA